MRQLSVTIGRVMLLWCAVALVSCAHSPKAVPGVHLTLHFASNSEEAAESLQHAKRVFRGIGYPLTIEGRHREDFKTLSEENRGDIAKGLESRDTLPVLLVPEILADADETSEAESYRGFWWREDNHNTVAISTQDVQEATLAHEIGHALGLEHTMNPDNIMCAIPCARNPNPKFSAEQVLKIRSAYRSFKSR